MTAGEDREPPAGSGDRPVVSPSPPCAPRDRFHGAPMRPAA